jgi:hypothetical protein
METTFFEFFSQSFFSKVNRKHWQPDKKEQSVFLLFLNLNFYLGLLFIFWQIKQKVHLDAQFVKRLASLNWTS